jgi:hydrogenase nickel incorporation protein HypB
MCTTCGCGHEAFGVSGPGHNPERHHHGQGGHHGHPHDTRIHHELSDPPLRASKRGKRVIQLEEDLLSKNKRFAEKNRHYLSGIHVLALNLVSSPGAGKTKYVPRDARDAAGDRGFGQADWAG